MLPIEVQRAPTLKTKPSSEGLGFGKYFTDHMFRMDYAPDRGWHQARILPHGPMGLDPGAAVLHYAQAVFDGSKVFRGKDGQLRAFRITDHCKRLHASAERLAMAPVPPELAREAIEALVRVEADWVPSGPGTALYVRPTLIASEAFLGVRPADKYIFFVILSPVGSYFAGGAEPVRIWVEQQHTRAAPGGLGGAKAAANYAAGLQASVEAKKRGYAQVLWLDALEHRYIEEVGTMNLFVRIGDELITPPLDGTFLPGITRESVLTLLRDWGMKVSERKLSIDELREAHQKGELREVFGTGTAAVISPVGALGFQEGQLVIGDGKVGEVSKRLYDTVTGIQYGTQPDRHGWMTIIK
ncbi:branched-chain amino acid aminotransferase [Archangium lansingense]|uniref:Branched-chain-amino-acid aminotransferase n=1 Tax=Archangium lansingense TaxID=2995310 RepID=A0ABT4ANK4_9BACT|nr:branched-chain amino acid aminotransferase [Archangium lansinium]MCY1083280.1 branched-chain amino acid aminotransferase [Archangium lansinium]